MGSNCVESRSQFGSMCKGRKDLNLSSQTCFQSGGTIDLSLFAGAKNFLVGAGGLEFTPCFDCLFHKWWAWKRLGSLHLIWSTRGMISSLCVRYFKYHFRDVHIILNMCCLYWDSVFGWWCMFELDIMRKYGPWCEKVFLSCVKDYFNRF